MKSRTKLNLSFALMGLLVSMVLFACSKDDDSDPTPSNPTTSNVNLESGLVAHYKLNLNYVDASNHFPQMTRTGTLNFSDDRFGNSNLALEFDSLNNNQHAAIEDSLIEFGKDFTFSYWFSLDTLASTIPQYTITSRFSSQGAEQGGLDMAVNDKLICSLRSNTSAVYARVTSQTLVAKKWYHVLVQQEEAELSLFLDNQLVGRDTITNFSNINFPKINYWSLGSGINSGPVILRELDGKLDDIRVYNRVVNSDERLALNREENP
ncbi:MAG: LamG domain-containing protein [Flavobacteriales bacterium]|nr:LamG domain-containing protein [Flavobacteriales bacterium]